MRRAQQNVIQFFLFSGTTDSFHILASGGRLPRRMMKLLAKQLNIVTRARGFLDFLFRIIHLLFISARSHGIRHNDCDKTHWDGHLLGALTNEYLSHKFPLAIK